MDNGTGEDLSWFWRGWFMNSWKVDQSITEVKPFMKEARLAGYTIKVNNLEKMPMPIILQIKLKSGKTETVKVPVDVWMKNTSWLVRYNTTEEIKEVILDPEKLIPDGNAQNNKWVSDGNNSVAAPNIDGLLGTYSSAAIPIKITLTKVDGALMAQATGQPMLTLTFDSGNKYIFEEGGIEVEFTADKTGFTLSQSGSIFVFTKDK